MKVLNMNVILTLQSSRGWVLTKSQTIKTQKYCHSNNRETGSIIYKKQKGIRNIPIRFRKDGDVYQQKWELKTKIYETINCFDYTDKIENKKCRD